MPPLPRLTLTVKFEPAETDLVVRQLRPPGSRISATKPSAVAFGSTVMVLVAVLPGATEIASEPMRSAPSAELASPCSAT